MITVGGTPLASDPGPATGGGGGSASTAQILSAVFGVSLVLRDPCALVVETSDLDSLPFGSAVYDAGAKTITATAHFNLNATLGESFVAGVTRFLFRLTDVEASKRNGIYLLTDLGSGSTSPVWTRAADCDSDADLVTGLAVLVGDDAGGWALWRLDPHAPLVLDTDPLLFLSYPAAP